MHHPHLFVVLAVILAACGPLDEFGCDVSLDPAVELGQGVAGAFAPFEDGSQVGLDIAPQGGFGVTAQVRTSGIGGGPAIVSVRTEIDGSPSGSFTFENDDGEPTLNLFCNDDAQGTLGSGVAVGFDADRWDQDNLTELDGVRADLIIDVTGQDGASASGRATVTIVVGG